MQYFSIVTLALLATFFSIFLVGVFLLKHKYEQHLVVTTLFWEEVINNVRKNSLLEKFSNLLHFLFLLLLLILLCLSLFNFYSLSKKNENIIIFDNSNIEGLIIKNKKLYLKEAKKIIANLKSNSTIIFTQPYAHIVDFNGGEFLIEDLNLISCNEKNAGENFYDALKLAQGFSEKNKKNIITISSNFAYRKIINFSEKLRLLDYKSNNSEIKILNYSLSNNNKFNVKFFINNLKEQDFVKVIFYNKLNGDIEMKSKINFIKNNENFLIDKDITLDSKIIKNKNRIAVKILSSNNDEILNENLIKELNNFLYYRKGLILPEIIKTLFSAIENLKLREFSSSLEKINENSVVEVCAKLPQKNVRGKKFILLKNVEKRSNFEALIFYKNDALISLNERGNILAINSELLQKLVNNNEDLLISQGTISKMINLINNFIINDLNSAKKDVGMPVFQCQINKIPLSKLKNRSMFNYNLFLILIACFIMCCDFLLLYKGKVN